MYAKLTARENIMQYGVTEHFNKACFKTPRWERMCGFRAVGVCPVNPEKFAEID
jgi:hypothetical protein